MNTTPARRNNSTPPPSSARSSVRVSGLGSINATNRCSNRLIRRSLERAAASARTIDASAFRPQGTRPAPKRDEGVVMTEPTEPTGHEATGNAGGSKDQASQTHPMSQAASQTESQDEPQTESLADAEAPVTDELTTLRAVLADAAAYFRSRLEDPTEGRRARRALSARALPILTAADGIGYAPEGWTALTTHLQELGYTDEHLLAAGVSTRCRTSALIDRFRARITFAIHDVAGDVVGFTARAFDEDRAAAAEAGHDLPKYLNTCETALYRKREVLYGLTPQVRNLLADGAVPVLVEGPTDALAITLAGAGGHVGIASCGTSLTTQHLSYLEDILQTLTNDEDSDEDSDIRQLQGQVRDLPRLRQQGLAAAFDSDAAGRAAARRAWELTTSHGLRTLEVVLPAEADPASLPRKVLTDLLTQADAPLNLSLIQDAVSPFAHRLHEDTSQLFAVRAAVRLIDPTHDDLDLGQCLTAVATATGADMTCVIDEVLNHRAQPTT